MFVGQLVMDQLHEQNVQLSEHSEAKRNTCGSATYGYHLRRTSITLSTSPFTLIPASPPYRSLFVLRRKGSVADERKRQNCCLLAEGEEQAEVE